MSRRAQHANPQSCMREYSLKALMTPSPGIKHGTQTWHMHLNEVLGSRTDSVLLSVLLEGQQSELSALQLFG